MKKYTLAHILRVYYMLASVSLFAVMVQQYPTSDSTQKACMLCVWLFTVLTVVITTYIINVDKK
jgi:hypothetical protein